MISLDIFLYVATFNRIRRVISMGVYLVTDAPTGVGVGRPNVL